MPFVLTIASAIPCSHNGSVEVSSAAKLHVNGNAVLVKSDIQGKSIAGCSTQKSDKSEQCTKVNLVMAGEGRKLTIGGIPVILEDVTGATDGIIGGTPQQLSKASAGQSKLKTE